VVDVGEDLRRRILEFLSSNGERSTGEVANALGADGRLVYYQLLLLASDGLVKKRKVTQKVTMWSITERGRESVRH
jgi:predicted ArsR family transcriptional regulator